MYRPDCNYRTVGLTGNPAPLPCFSLLLLSVLSVLSAFFRGLNPLQPFAVASFSVFSCFQPFSVFLISPASITLLPLLQDGTLFRH